MLLQACGGKRRERIAIGTTRHVVFNVKIYSIYNSEFYYYKILPH